MFKHILLPTDGSSLSQQTALRAISFAREARASITALHVRPDYPIFFYGEGTSYDPGMIDDYAKVTENKSQEYLGFIKQSCDDAGVECNTISVADIDIYKAIIEEAKNNGCDLIFMASHGRGGISSLLLGSETQKVLAHTRIPVLIYR